MQDGYERALGNERKLKRQLELNREKVKFYDVRGVDHAHTNLIVMAKSIREAINIAREIGRDIYKEKLTKELENVLKNSKGAEKEYRELVQLMLENYEQQELIKISAKKIATQLRDGVYLLETYISLD